MPEGCLFSIPPKTGDSLKCNIFCLKTHWTEHSLTLLSKQSWKVCTMKLLKKHKHTLAGNYNSCITTIYGNNCRLQVLYDNVVSVSGDFRQYRTSKSLMSFTFFLQSMYSDMHVKHQHLQYVVFLGIESLMSEAVTPQSNCFSRRSSSTRMCMSEEPS